MDKGQPPPAYPGYPPQQQPAGVHMQQPPQQAYMAPPPQQYGTPPQHMAPPQGVVPPQQVVITTPDSITASVHSGIATTTAVVATTGSCPSCRRGMLIENYSMVGIVLAILFFPLGVLCCLLMKERRCAVCGYIA